MTKKSGPVEPLRLREWARLTVAEAVCGYVARKGMHQCVKWRPDAVRGFCKDEHENLVDTVSWQGMMGVIEGVLDEVETAAREVEAARR